MLSPFTHQSLDETKEPNYVMLSVNRIFGSTWWVLAKCPGTKWALACVKS